MPRTGQKIARLSAAARAPEAGSAGRPARKSTKAPPEPSPLKPRRADRKEDRMKEVMITRRIFEPGDIIRPKKTETLPRGRALVYHSYLKKDGNVSYKVIQEDKRVRSWFQYEDNTYELVDHVDLGKLFTKGE